MRIGYGNDTDILNTKTQGMFLAFFCGIGIPLESYPIKNTLRVRMRNAHSFKCNRDSKEIRCHVEVDRYVANWCKSFNILL